MTEQSVALDRYLKVGVHIGTKFRNKYMAPFIYKVRPDGLSVMNIQQIDERIKLAAKFLAQYDSKDILLVCRRENGWTATKMFSKVTGVRCITGRYPPGLMTNPNLESFVEAKIIFVVDPWPDKNAVLDAKKVGLPIIALCDTNNECNDLDFVVPCNNKGKKSLGMILWVLANEFLRQKGTLKADQEIKETSDEFAGE
ncbi:30S ribosomal protein S2 [Candidatus Woesearchaeota archaeon]|nr:30S ribosomal protein S2 [Candidatus Woesearchaeota archaeon]